MYKIIRATTMLLKCTLVCSGFTAGYLFVPSYLLIPLQIVIGLVIYFYPRSSISTLVCNTRQAAQSCIARDVWILAAHPDEYLTLEVGCDDTIVITGQCGATTLVRYTLQADGGVYVDSIEPPWDNTRLRQELTELLSSLQPVSPGLVLSRSK